MRYVLMSDEELESELEVLLRELAVRRCEDGCELARVQLVQASAVAAIIDVDLRAPLTVSPAAAPPSSSPRARG